MEMFRALLPIMTRLSKIGVQDLEQLWYHRAPHHTLIHGDAHSANLAVGADVRILDWQTYRIGSPSFDVLYYLCTSTPLDDFVAHRRHLVALYVEKLCELGIKDVTVDDILSPIASVCTYALHILWVGGGLGMEEREQTRGVLAPLLLRMERRRAREEREARQAEQEAKVEEERLKKEEDKEKQRQLVGSALAAFSGSGLSRSSTSTAATGASSSTDAQEAFEQAERDRRHARERLLAEARSSSHQSMDPEDVEAMMARRRKAQIEAEALKKADAEKRAAEERELAIANEPVARGLPRLIAIKGHNRPRAVLVECSIKSLNMQNHFILETADSIFHWKGPKADISKLKYAVASIAKLRKERLRKVKVVSMKPDEAQPEFWGALGATSHKDVPERTDEPREQEWESTYDASCRFYRSDKDVGLLPEPELNPLCLSESSSAFVLVTQSEFYLWFGNAVGLNQRKLTESKAIEDLAWECERWVRPQVVLQGKEPHLFQEKFPNWETAADANTSTPSTQRKKVGEIQIQRMLAFDPDLIPVLDDVYGTVEVWVASDYGKVPVGKDMRGIFFNGSSYILLYHGVRETILYFWQGSASLTLWSHAKTAILEVVQKAQESLKIVNVPIVRLLEGDEPPHMLGIFGGKMTVRKGVFGDYDTIAHPLRMYHIRGFNAFNTRCVECSPTGSLLDSDDAFVVHDTKNLFVWKGDHCSTYLFEIAQEIAKGMQSQVAGKTIVVNDQLEPPHFWKVLGGKRDHPRHLEVPPQCPPDRIKPRLFIYSKGVISGKGAVLFSHLRSHDQVVLDTWDRVYVWSGRFSASKDSFFAKQVAQAYLEAQKRGSVKIVEVKETEEPSNFTRYFQGWQFPEVTLSKEAQEVKQVVSQYAVCFTLEQLQNKETLPITINKQKLEAYLSDVEFVEVFGMPKNAWYQLPAWKRTDQKREKGLF